MKKRMMLGLLALAALLPATLAAAGTRPTPTFTPYVAGKNASGTVYYVSSKEGSDTNTGKSASSPLKTLAAASKLRLKAGDKLLLQRGSLFRDMLVQAGKGTADSPITLADYGDAKLPPPRIKEPDDLKPFKVVTYQSRDFGAVDITIQGFKAVTLNSVSHWKIENLDFDGGKIGIYLAYTGEPQVGIDISHCGFYDIASRDPSLFFYDTDIGALTPRITDGGGVFGNILHAGVWAGGAISKFDYKPDSRILTDLSITNCVFDGTENGFGDNFYWPRDIRFNLLQRIYLADCDVNGAIQGGFVLNHAKDIYIERFHIRSGGGFSSTGICGAFLMFVEDVVIYDCTFSNIQRLPHPDFGTYSHDGVGLDLEGASVRVSIISSRFLNNAGAGLMVCNTDMQYTKGNVAVHPSTDLLVKDCVFENNASNPDSLDEPQRSGLSNFQVLSWQANSTAKFQGNTFVNSEHDLGNFSSNMKNWVIVP